MLYVVLGTKNPNGAWNATILSSNHSGTDPVEIARIYREHPEESECVKSGRVLAAIAVTRGEYFLSSYSEQTTFQLIHPYSHRRPRLQASIVLYHTCLPELCPLFSHFYQVRGYSTP